MYSDEYYNLRDLFDTRALAENTVNRNSYTLPMADGHILQISHGAKPVKALGKLAKAYNEEAYKLFEAFRLEHSQVLNVKALKGTLCLSIHPLDYMTMSDNMSDWNSCMSWTDCGSYRRGTVEMMNSPMVVVGYLKSDKNYYPCCDCCWNDKRWRSLFVVHNDVVISIKGYPYCHDELSQTCVNWLSELVSENTGTKYHKAVKIDYCTEQELFGHRIRLDPHANGAMYNDFGCSIHWGALRQFTEEDDYLIRLNFNYCGDSVCMCCGAVEPYFEEEGYLCCSNCEDQCEDGYDRYYCYECDCSLYEDEIHWIGDNAYCYHCATNLAYYCYLTEEWVFKEETVPVYLAVEKDKPDVERDVFANINEYYLDCGLDYGWRHTYTNGRYPSKWVDPEDPTNIIYYWNVDELPKDGISQIYRLWTDAEIEAYKKRS
jgi:hypothetical protein